MEYKIYTGSMLAIKNGFLRGKFRLMYCGMPNESTIAITPYIADGYQGFSPTIFYNANSKVIHILDRDFDVLEIDPDFIILGD